MENETNTNVEATVESTGAEESSEKITLTQAELDALIQKSGDKRVSQALKTAERKQREAEKLRGMNADDQREYNLSQREAAIAAKEVELARLENKSEGISILAEKGLDAKLIDFVLSDDAEEMYDKIKALDKAFKLSVKNEVEKRLASKVPTQSLPGELSSVTKEQFKKMNMLELTRLKNEQPELFEQLATNM